MVLGKATWGNDLYICKDELIGAGLGVSERQEIRKQSGKVSAKKKRHKAATGGSPIPSRVTHLLASDGCTALSPTQILLLYTQA